jgi:hypothetical protein
MIKLVEGLWTISKRRVNKVGGKNLKKTFTHSKRKIFTKLYERK